MYSGNPDDLVRYRDTKLQKILDKWDGGRKGMYRSEIKIEGNIMYLILIQTPMMAVAQEHDILVEERDDSIGDNEMKIRGNDGKVRKDIGKIKDRIKKEKKPKKNDE